MRRRLMVIAIVLGCGIVGGCTPGDSVEPPSSESPVPVAVTPEATPSPTWTPLEQGAIDSVHAYLAKWAEISQNVATADWSEIYGVADQPAVDYAYQAWEQWRDSGRHIVGGAVFTTETVEWTTSHPMGERYIVRGCSDMTSLYVVDSDGQQASERVADELFVRFEVVLTPHDAFIVVNETVEESSCEK